MEHDDDLLFHLAISSRFEHIELVQVVLGDSLRRLDLDAEACHWIDVAVREAVANAIKHGNQQDPDKKVEVALRVVDRELVIEVEDEGEGFDVSTLDDPRDPSNLLKPTGRGIFYMHNFMDAVDYGKGGSGGTLVTLRKRLAPATGDGSD